MKAGAAGSAVLLGCDFSSAPTRRKPIVVALGQAQGPVVRLLGLAHFATLDG